MVNAKEFVERNPQHLAEDVEKVTEAVLGGKLFMLADKWMLTADNKEFEQELFDEIIKAVRKKIWG